MNIEHFFCISKRMNKPYTFTYKNTKHVKLHIYTLHINTLAVPNPALGFWAHSCPKCSAFWQKPLAVLNASYLGREPHFPHNLQCTQEHYRGPAMYLRRPENGTSHFCLLMSGDDCMCKHMCIYIICELYTLYWLNWPYTSILPRTKHIRTPKIMGMGQGDQSSFPPPRHVFNILLIRCEGLYR